MVISSPGSDALTGSTEATAAEDQLVRVVASWAIGIRVVSDVPVEVAYPAEYSVMIKRVTPEMGSQLLYRRHFSSLHQDSFALVTSSGITPLSGTPVIVTTYWSEPEVVNLETSYGHAGEFGDQEVQLEVGWTLHTPSSHDIAGMARGWVAGHVEALFISRP